MRRIASLALIFLGICLSAGAGAADIDWSNVDQALGKKGANQPGGVHKYSLPRSDLKVIVDGDLARHQANLNVQSFIKGAYAAAIGTILGASILLGRIAIGDWFTALTAIGALVILFRWKVSNPLLMAATAVAGLIAFPLLHPTWMMLK